MSKNGTKYKYKISTKIVLDKIFNFRQFVILPNYFPRFTTHISSSRKFSQILFSVYIKIRIKNICVAHLNWNFPLRKICPDFRKVINFYFVVFKIYFQNSFPKFIFTRISPEKSAKIRENMSQEYTVKFYFK